MPTKADLHLPACLIIMDGFGIEEPGRGNAISQASTPFLDRFLTPVLLPFCKHRENRWDCPKAKWAIQRSGT